MILQLPTRHRKLRRRPETVVRLTFSAAWAKEGLHHDERPMMSSRQQSRGTRKRRADAKFNIALARGLSILRAFRAGEAYLGTTELSARTGIPKPTVSRLAYTLVKEGYLTRLGEIDKYQLSTGSLDLGYSVLASLGLNEIARPLMRELASESQATIGLGLRDDLSVVYVEYAKGEAALASRASIGLRVPLAMTTLGWCCLYVMQEAERRQTLERIREASGLSWQKVNGSIQRAFDEIEQHGFCIALGEFMPEISSVGVPFGDAGSQRQYAFNCTGVRSILSRQELTRKWGPRLVELRQKLEPLRAAVTG